MQPPRSYRVFYIYNAQIIAMQDIEYIKVNFLNRDLFEAGGVVGATPR